MAKFYQASAALQSPESCATVLHLICMRAFGEEYLGWDPTTVALEIRDEFQVEAADEVLNKICAVQLLLATGGFFDRLDAFMAIVSSLAVGDPQFQVLDPPTAEEIAWGLAEASLLRELKPFSYAVKRFVRQTLSEDGYSDGERPAIFAEVFDSKPSASTIKGTLTAADKNDSNIDEFIGAQLQELGAQVTEVFGPDERERLFQTRATEESLQESK